MVEQLLSNKPIPKIIEKQIEDLFALNDDPLFAIVGDLSVDGDYEQNVACFTTKKLYVFNCEITGEPQIYSYSELKNIKSKRMYGNSILIADTKYDKQVIILRYSFKIARLCDAVKQFIEHINNGADLKEEYAVMGVAFENAVSVCPKCGRFLLHPGADCINCRSKMRIMSHFIKYLKPLKGKIVFSGFLSVIATLMALVPPAITGYIVDNVFGSGNSGFLILKWYGSIFKTSQKSQLLAMVLLLLITHALMHGLNALRSYKMRSVGDVFSNEMRKDVYKKVMGLPISFFDRSSAGTVINRILGDVANIQNFTNRITQEAIGHFFQLIGIMVLMISINPILALLSLFPIPLIVFTSRIFSKKIRPFYQRIWRNSANINSTLTDTIPCVKVIKSFAGEDRASNAFNKVTDNYIETSLKMGKMITFFPQAISFLVACGSLGIWLLGGTKVLNSVTGYSVGLLVSFISYASMFYTPVTFFANLSDSFQNAMSSAEKVLDIFEAAPELEAQNPVIPDNLKGEIEFNHVTFSFDKTKKVLDDVSFKIKPGEIVGIVGTTGSGKSTLVNLLLRFYDGYSGEILVDGHNIRNYDLQSYRNEIGYVQQEPMLFSDTILNNLLFSKPDATIEEVFEATKIANADGFICRQPEGYDTMLGERGIGISGGEKQRLSIARAVLKKPSMMIFDEATAAVDSETERLIQDAIDKLIEGKTTLMIAHRLSTLKKATRILVVDNGRIIENGTPEELLAKKGKYYKLVKIQSMSADVEKMKKEENLNL